MLFAVCKCFVNTFLRIQYLTIKKKNPARLSFNISASGESLFLFDTNGQLLDKLSAGRMKSGLSYGRDGSDNRMYYTEPTPGSANGSGYTR